MRKKGFQVFAIAVLLAVALSPSLAEDQAVPAHVALHMREAEGKAYLEAENVSRVAYEVLVDRRATDGEDTYHVVAPGQTIVVLRFGGLTRDEAIAAAREMYRFETFMGDPAAITSEADHLYRLPFREGKTYRMSQGFGGKESHDHEGSRYAVDFQLEVGEPVHAARAGLVVKVVDRYREAGDASFVSMANLIIVLHDDGTMAHYVHLEYRGSLVKEGDRVERGQHIGSSGMTGYTRGPHLHFVVRKARDVAVPVRFEGYEEADLSKRGRFRVGGESPRRK